MYCYLHSQVEIFTFFTAWSSYASAVLGIVILSVCQTRALWRNERTYCRYFDITRKGNHSRFLTPTEDGGRCAFHLKFALKLTHPPPLKKSRLRPISAYYVWTVTGSENVQLSQIGSWPRAFPTSYRWSAYVTPDSPKGGSKSEFVVFVNKIQV